MSDDRIFPHAQPGSQSGMTRAGALAAAAATLAAGAFAVHSATSVGKPPQAPRCPPSVQRPGDWMPDDHDGCWEQRDGRTTYRTTWAGRNYYHWSPPSSSRYYGSESIGG